MSDGHFSTDPLLSIIKILSPTWKNGKYVRLPNQARVIVNSFSWLIDGINSFMITASAMKALTGIFPEYITATEPLHHVSTQTFNNH